MLGDKGYDTDEIIQAIKTEGAQVVIPSKKNRKEQRVYDKHVYKERHKIECMFGFLKHYRRVFSRFDKLKKRFRSMLHFAAAMHWLR